MRLLPREYQQNIAQSILDKGNTLVVLPTGLGKTLIGAIVIEHFLKEGKRAVFLAPTRPLVNQHSVRLKEYLGLEPTVITGESPALARKSLYDNKIIVSTPQCIANDLSKWDIFGGVAVVIFDEAHRAVGRYAYTAVAKAANDHGVLIVGLTASPGGRTERIKETMDSLFVNNVEIRTEEEKDIIHYIQPLEIKWEYVELTPELQTARDSLNELLDEKAVTLKEFGITVSRKMARSRLSQIYRALIEHKNLAALGHFARFYEAFHGNELLETESPFAFVQFVERLKERKKRVDWRVVKVANAVKELEHPKMKILLEILKEKRNMRIIIFAQYRDQVNHIVDVLKKEGFSARPFLGKREGSQKEQKKTIEDFAAGEFNILVASSIGEEGIDIPAVDTAVFYEPVPSEIRSIQRRGRVGRSKGGEVIILVTKGTRDETFRWVALSREKKMRSVIAGIKKGKINRLRKQPSITDFL
jgi:Fanconi anemia group M protein